MSHQYHIMVVDHLKVEGYKREIVWLGILMLFADFVVEQEKSFFLKASVVTPQNAGWKNEENHPGVNLLDAEEHPIGELNLERNKKPGKYTEYWRGNSLNTTPRPLDAQV